MEMLLRRQVDNRRRDVPPEAVRMPRTYGHVDVDIVSTPAAGIAEELDWPPVAVTTIAIVALRLDLVLIVSVIVWSSE
jgi:phage shock protein PspC (stress-responsive transcriptional regulator)